MTTHAFTKSLQDADAAALEESLAKDVVFHSPALVTGRDEWKCEGRDLVARILGNAIGWFGAPQSVAEYHSADDRRYVVTFSGSVDGLEFDAAGIVTEDAAGRVTDLRLSMRPAPVVRLFIGRMKPAFRDEIPERYFSLP
jgi:hypothetical protein